MNKTIKEIIGLWKEYHTQISDYNDHLNITKLKSQRRMLKQLSDWGLDEEIHTPGFPSYNFAYSATNAMNNRVDKLKKEASFEGFMEWLKDNYKEELSE